MRILQLWSVSYLTGSVERVVGVEDGGEEPEGERSDAKRHVEAGFSKAREHLSARRKPVREVFKLNKNIWKRRLTPPLVSGSVLCPWGRGGVFNLNDRSRNVTQQNQHRDRTKRKARRTWGPPGWSSPGRRAGWPSLCWCPLYTRGTAACWAESPTTEGRKETSEQQKQPGTFGN